MCGLARPGAHGPGTKLDLSDLPLWEGWVPQRNAEAAVRSRPSGCGWASPDASSLLSPVFRKSPGPSRSVLASHQPLLCLSMSPSPFPFPALGLCPCSSLRLECSCSTSAAIQCVPKASGPQLSLPSSALLLRVSMALPHPSSHAAWCQGCLWFFHYPYDLV